MQFASVIKNIPKHIAQSVTVVTCQIQINSSDRATSYLYEGTDTFNFGESHIFRVWLRRKVNSTYTNRTEVKSKRIQLEVTIRK